LSTWAAAAKGQPQHRNYTPAKAGLRTGPSWEPHAGHCDTPACTLKAGGFAPAGSWLGRPQSRSLLRRCTSLLPEARLYELNPAAPAPSTAHPSTHAQSWRAPRRQLAAGWMCRPTWNFAAPRLAAKAPATNCQYGYVAKASYHHGDVPWPAHSKLALDTSWQLAYDVPSSV